MDQHTLSIGGHVFALRGDADIARLQARVIEVVRAGGGMVDIPASGADSISALISPGLAVLFQVHHVPDGQSAGDDTVEWTPLYVGEPDWYFG